MVSVERQKGFMPAQTARHLKIGVFFDSIPLGLLIYTEKKHLIFFFLAFFFLCVMLNTACGMEYLFR